MKWLSIQDAVNRAYLDALRARQRPAPLKPILLAGALLAVFALAVLTSGCSLAAPFTGPNRWMKVLSNEKVADFATFEGVATTACRDVYALIEGVHTPTSTPGTVVGCVLGVTPVGGESERAVFFPLGGLRDQARAIPPLARCAVNGRPLGAAGYVADGVEWRSE